MKKTIILLFVISLSLSSISFAQGLFGSATMLNRDAVSTVPDTLEYREQCEEIFVAGSWGTSIGDEERFETTVILKFGNRTAGEIEWIKGEMSRYQCMGSVTLRTETAINDKCTVCAE